MKTKNLLMAAFFAFLVVVPSAFAQASQYPINSNQCTLPWLSYLGNAIGNVVTGHDLTLGQCVSTETRCNPDNPNQVQKCVFNSLTGCTEWAVCTNDPVYLLTHGIQQNPCQSCQYGCRQPTDAIGQSYAFCGSSLCTSLSGSQDSCVVGVDHRCGNMKLPGHEDAVLASYTCSHDEVTGCNGFWGGGGYGKEPIPCANGCDYATGLCKDYNNVPCSSDDAGCLQDGQKICVAGSYLDTCVETTSGCYKRSGQTTPCANGCQVGSSSCNNDAGKPISDPGCTLGSIRCATPQDSNGIYLGSYKSCIPDPFGGFKNVWSDQWTSCPGGQCVGDMCVNTVSPEVVASGYYTNGCNVQGDTGCAGNNDEKVCQPSALANGSLQWQRGRHCDYGCEGKGCKYPTAFGGLTQLSLPTDQLTQINRFGGLIKQNNYLILFQNDNAVLSHVGANASKQLAVYYNSTGHLVGSKPVPNQCGLIDAGIVDAYYDGTYVWFITNAGVDAGSGVGQSLLKYDANMDNCLDSMQLLSGTGSTFSLRAVALSGNDTSLFISVSNISGPLPSYSEGVYAFPKSVINGSHPTAATGGFDIGFGSGRERAMAVYPLLGDSTRDYANQSKMSFSSSDNFTYVLKSSRMKYYLRAGYWDEFIPEAFLGPPRFSLQLYANDWTLVSTIPLTNTGRTYIGMTFDDLTGNIYLVYSDAVNQSGRPVYQNLGLETILKDTHCTDECALGSGRCAGFGDLSSQQCVKGKDGCNHWYTGPSDCSSSTDPNCGDWALNYCQNGCQELYVNHYMKVSYCLNETRCTNTCQPGQRVCDASGMGWYNCTLKPAWASYKTLHNCQFGINGTCYLEDPLVGLTNMLNLNNIGNSMCWMYGDQYYRCGSNERCDNETSRCVPAVESECQANPSTGVNETMCWQATYENIQVVAEEVKNFQGVQRDYGMPNGWQRDQTYVVTCRETPFSAGRYIWDYWNVTKCAAGCTDSYNLTYPIGSADFNVAVCLNPDSVSTNGQSFLRETGYWFGIYLPDANSRYLFSLVLMVVFLVAGTVLTRNWQFGLAAALVVGNIMAFTKIPIRSGFGPMLPPEFILVEIIIAGLWLWSTMRPHD